MSSYASDILGKVKSLQLHSLYFTVDIDSAKCNCIIYPNWIISLFNRTNSQSSSYLGQCPLEEVQPEYTEDGAEADETDADGGQAALFAEQILEMHLDV